MKRLFFLLPFLLMIGCESETGGPVSGFDSFDRKAMLKNIGENVIIPAFESFSAEATAFEQACSAFAASPSAAGLTAAQDQWKKTAYAWKLSEPYQFGILGGEANALLASIDIGSAEPMQIQNPVDRQAVEAVVSGTDAISQDYIDSRPARTKGFFTLEYMLFSRTMDNSAILALYNDPATGQRRGQYLLNLAQKLRAQAASIVSDWQPSGGNYLQTFSQADGRDIGSSVSLLVNNLVYQVEMMKNEKTGRPLGKSTSGNIQPNAVEARESKNSIDFIKRNLTAIESAFLGKGKSGDGSGLDDLLNHLNATFGNEPLAKKISEQITVVQNKADMIGIPLDEAVTANPQAVDDLYTEIKKLLVLMKVDMVNNIGVIITYIDNDGD